MLGGSFSGCLPHTSDLVNQPCPAHSQHGQRRCATWRVFAMASRQANKQAPRQSRKRGELPETGYFAQADPSAQVYIPRGGQEPTDVTKRGGRYTSDFVWNTNWQDQLDDEKKREEQQHASAAEDLQQSGKQGLSFSRVSDLQSLQKDLTVELREAKAKAERRVQEAAAAAAATARNVQADVPPTQGEARRWLRSGRYSRKAVATPTPAESVKLAEEAAAEKERYDRLKDQLQTWCLGTALVCFGATVVFYSKDTATSYGFGAVGSIVYLRMLNRSMDGVGGVGAALGQPRLLVPVILTAAFNRWNLLAVDKTGITLQLLPMLLGFFTYKAAVIAQTGLSVLESLSSSEQTATPEDAATSAMNTETNSLYVQRILTK